jgi:hypothetical protein
MYSYQYIFDHQGDLGVNGSVILKGSLEKCGHVDSIHLATDTKK